MKDNNPVTKESQAQSETRWEREEVAAKLLNIKEAEQQGVSERTAAKINEVARSTARYWKKRDKSLREDSGLAPEVINFFESPVGMAFLHQLVIAMMFVTMFRPGGLRTVQEWLELSDLQYFVASSMGTLHKVNVNMESETSDFAEKEFAVMEQEMAEKEITLCKDESFHSGTCLDAIEPVSGFIIVEKDAENRTAVTWELTVSEALGDLPVKVIQSTSDEAPALLCYAKESGVNHSPDLFHIQHNLFGYTSRPLAKKVKDAEEAYAKTVKAFEKILSEGYTPDSGTVTDFSLSMAEAHKAEQEACLALIEAMTNQSEMHNAIAGLSKIYHPYSLEDGAKRSSEDIASLIDKLFGTIKTVASKAGLSDKCLKNIDNALDIKESMLEIIEFFHIETAFRLPELKLTPESELAVEENLIPGLYLQRVAERMGDTEERDKLLKTAEGLLAPLRDSTHPLQLMTDSKLDNIMTVSLGCIDIFQRSSSCVEGRNGQLSLFHHIFHRLSERKQAALKTVHNYHIRRLDGSTAAERFSGLSHDNLFEWLLERMPLLPKPAKKRKRTHKTLLENIRNEGDQVFRKAG